MISRSHLAGIAGNSQVPTPVWELPQIPVLWYIGVLQLEFYIESFVSTSGSSCSWPALPVPCRAVASAVELLLVLQSRCPALLKAALCPSVPGVWLGEPHPCGVCMELWRGLSPLMINKQLQRGFLFVCLFKP